MPHITVEHSANLAEHHDIGALVRAVHDAALAHGLAPVEALRTRAASREHFRIATGDRRFAFVAISCRMAPGRDPEAKRSFLGDVLDAAERQVSATECPLAIAWSIEITEIDPRFRLNRNHVRDALEET